MTHFFNQLAMQAKRTACLLLIVATAPLSAQLVEPGTAPTLAENEGYALFDINIDMAIEKIQLDRVGSIFSFPKIADLPEGKYTRLLKLPAGNYQFTKFQSEFFYWEFDDVRNRNFTIEPGKINYVGEVQSRATGWLSRSLVIENTALVASRNLARDYPGIAGKYPWRYTGEYADPFMEIKAQDIYGQQPPDSGIEPRIEDRDAAEIMFRAMSKHAGALSPDGRFVLETTSEGSKIAIRLIDLNAPSERVIYTGEPISRALWINPETLVLTFQGTTYQSRVLRVKSTKDVTEIPLALGWVIGSTPDQKHLILVANYNNKTNIKVLDITKGLDLKRIKSAPHLHPSVRKFADVWIDGQGKLRLYEVVQANRQKYSRYVYFDPASNKSVEFKVEDVKNQTLTFVGFDKNAIPLVLTNKDRNEIELVEFNTQTATLGKTVKSIKNTDLMSVIYGLNHEIVGVRYLSQGRQIEASLDDARSSRLRSELAIKLPQSNVNVTEFASDGRALVYVESSKVPGDIYVYQPASKRLDLLTQIAPHLDGRPLAGTERFIVKAKDGFEIESFLTQMNPDDARKKPLLVLPHGGPFGIVDFQHFDPEVQYFAKLGYAVLQVNFRGSGGTGSANRELGIKQWGDRMIDDIEAATDEALRRFKLDDQRVVTMGTSYGAYSAVRLAQRNPARYKSVVAIAGVFDLHMLFNSGRYSRNERDIDWLKSHVGDPVKDFELISRQSPTYAPQLVKAPVLVVHDRGDDIAPFEHAIRLQLALKREKKNIELITVNDGLHGLVRPSTAIATYPKIAHFLCTHLSAPPEQ